jgi:2,4'-dihydroxyacetophenone dioxygenase
MANSNAGSSGFLGAALAEAQHVGANDVPWVPNPAYAGTEFRLLKADLAAGLYVMHGRLPSGMEVGTHHHTGSVHMITLSGSWGYREHDYLNTAGSYLYEPPDSTHTLFVPVQDEVTETYSIIYGETEYFDADGQLVAVSNAETNLRGFYEACELAGIERPQGILR